MTTEQREIYVEHLLNSVRISNCDVYECDSPRTFIAYLLDIPDNYYPIPDNIFNHFIIWVYNNQDFTFNANLSKIAREDVVLISFGVSNNIVHLCLNKEQYADLRIVFNELRSDDRSNSMDIITKYALNVDLSEQDIAFLINIGLIKKVFKENSSTLLIKDNTARFSGAMWYEEIQKKTIILAGVGGIGSWVALLLSRMNPKAIFMYDDDRVETVNMSGQFYMKPDVGKYKVDAMSSTMSDFSDYSSTFAVTEKFTEETQAGDIMICGFDSINARKMFFNSWLKHVQSKSEEERKHCLFIDGRLAAEELQVYCITGDNLWAIQEYNNKALFMSSDAEETTCSYKQTSYMANIIAGIMVNLFTNFVANEIFGFLGRDLPYYTSYNGSTMQLKLE